MIEKAIIFMIGAVGYTILEILARGFTHWTMSILGGVCLLILWKTAHVFYDKPVWVQAILGGGIITVVEFFTGVVLNLWLGLNIWSYEEQFAHILGQICPLYTVIWIFLSAIVCCVIKIIMNKQAETK